MDNLNIHCPASLYEAFPPAEARRLADRREIHHTPEHGSWLNMAEIGRGILQRRCLDRRPGDRATLARGVAAWTVTRNAATQRIDWRFTPAPAVGGLRRASRTDHERWPSRRVRAGRAKRAHAGRAVARFV